MAIILTSLYRVVVNIIIYQYNVLIIYCKYTGHHEIFAIHAHSDCCHFKVQNLQLTVACPRTRNKSIAEGDGTESQFPQVKVTTLSTEVCLLPTLYSKTKISYSV